MNNWVEWSCDRLRTENLIPTKENAEMKKTRRSKKINHINWNLQCIKCSMVNKWANELCARRWFYTMLKQRVLWMPFSPLFQRLCSHIFLYPLLRLVNSYLALATYTFSIYFHFLCLIETRIGTIFNSRYGNIFAIDLNKINIRSIYQ